MNAVTASALRRAAIWAAALAITLAGHALGSGDVRMLPIAPALWLGVTALTVPLGARRASAGFRTWGPVRMLVSLLVLQTALHVTMHTAPWAFGLVGHSHGPLVTTGTVIGHVAAALALTVLLCAGERILAGVVRVARALLGPDVRRPRVPRAPRRLGLDVASPVCAELRAPRSSRGPPAWGSAS